MSLRLKLIRGAPKKEPTLEPMANFLGVGRLSVHVQFAPFIVVQRLGGEFTTSFSGLLSH